jgi:hypothetical protein
MSDEGVDYPMVSAPAGQGDGVAAITPYSVGGYPTIFLIAPDRKVVVPDIWPADEIMATLARYPIDTATTAVTRPHAARASGRLPAAVAIERLDAQRIALGIRQAGAYSLSVYTLDGRLLQTAYRGYLAQGRHEIAWDVGRASKGMYVVRVSSGSQIAAERSMFNR